MNMNNNNFNFTFNFNNNTNMNNNGINNNNNNDAIPNPTLPPRPRKRRVFRQFVEDDEDQKMNIKSQQQEKEQSPELSPSPVTPSPEPNIPSKQANEVAITSVVIDYDDTIFPTFALKEIFRRKVIHNGIVHDIITHPAKYSYQELLLRISCQELKELESLSMITYQFLCYYLNKYGNKNIFIVSAAHKNWMKHSLEILINIGFYKHIYDLLFNNPLTMIQIENPSSDHLPFNNSDQITKWKFNTFQTLLNRIKSSYDNVDSSEYKICHGFVSIGDGKYEHKAAEMLRDPNPTINNTFIHRVKLMHHPKINNLMIEQSQLTQICGMFELHTLRNKTCIDINYDN